MLNNLNLDKLVAGRFTMFAQTPPEKFRSSLFKGSQGLGAAPRVATRKWRNSPFGVSLLRAFLFAPEVSKRKAGNGIEEIKSLYAFAWFFLLLPSVNSNRR